MKILYVVTTGEYDDYQIKGIFDSIELANLFIDSFDSKNVEYGGFNDIEEWELNANESDLRGGKKAFAVTISKDGSILNAIQRGCPGINVGRWPSISSDISDNIPYDFWQNEKGEFASFLCYALNKEDAIKMADEKMSEILKNWE